MRLLQKLFSKEPCQSTEYDIVIGEKSQVNGDIATEGSVFLDGKIEGNLTAQGQVVVSQKAQVTGNIKGQAVEMYGKCKGNVETKTSLIVYGEASLIGDVVCESLTTTPGCEFQGNVQVVPAAVSAPKKADKTPTPESGKKQ